MAAPTNPTTPGRPVQIYRTEYRGRSRYAVPEHEGRGRFHCWSVAHEEYESGPGAFAVAIVEMENGFVRVVAADNVQFLDGEEAANESR
jgi:hypothetical protein